MRCVAVALALLGLVGCAVPNVPMRLVPDTRAVAAIRISEPVLDKIRAKWDSASTHGVEFGACLYGGVDGKKVLTVHRLEDPIEVTFQARDGIQFSCDEEADDYVADLHTHPAGDYFPSGTDVHTFLTKDRIALIVVVAAPDRFIVMNREAELIPIMMVSR